MVLRRCERYPGVVEFGGSIDKGSCAGWTGVHCQGQLGEVQQTIHIGSMVYE